MYNTAPGGNLQTSGAVVDGMREVCNFNKSRASFTKPQSVLMAIDHCAAAELSDELSQSTTPQLTESGYLIASHPLHLIIDSLSRKR